MKVLKKSGILVIILASLCKPILAQGWVYFNRKIYGIGTTPTQVFHLPYKFYNKEIVEKIDISSPLSISSPQIYLLKLQWQSGIYISPAGWYHNENDNHFYKNSSSDNPLGIKTNLHLLESNNKKVNERLYIDAGITTGFGKYYPIDTQNWRFTALVFLGPKISIHYRVKKVILYGGLGWGANFLNVGMTH